MATIVASVLLVAMAILGVLANRRRGDRYYLVLAALGAVGAVIAVVRSLGGGVALIGLLDLPVALVVFVMAAEAIGLPAPVATRLGVGFRSRAWEYDRALYRAIADIERSLSGQPGRGGPAHRLVRARPPHDGRRLMARLRALRAPGEDWGRLTDQYSDAYQAWFDAIDKPSTDRFAELEQRLSALHREREQLRAKYRAEASQLHAGSRAARLLRQPPRD